MPNWVVGTLKIRGEKQDIERLLLEGLTPVDYAGATLPVQGSFYDDSTYLEITSEGHGCFHIKGTRRHFIEQIRAFRQFHWAILGQHGILTLALCKKSH